MRVSNGRQSYAWQKVRAEVLARAQDCALCGLPLDFQAQPMTRFAPSVDHIVPVTLGGELLDPANLRPAHFGCNSQRGNGQRQPARHGRRW